MSEHYSMGSIAIQMVALVASIIGAGAVIMNRIDSKISDLGDKLTGALEKFDKRLGALEKEHWELKGSHRAFFHCRATDRMNPEALGNDRHD